MILTSASVLFPARRPTALPGRAHCTRSRSSGFTGFWRTERHQRRIDAAECRVPWSMASWSSNTLMNDEAPFIEAVQAAPGDTGLLLIYADWLEERGDSRAEFL